MHCGKCSSRFYPSLAEVKLEDFKVRVLDGRDGTGAKVRVLIESSDGKSRWGTVGVSTNIIEASWLALIDALKFKLMKEKLAGGAERRKRRFKADILIFYKTRRGRITMAPQLDWRNLWLSVPSDRLLPAGGLYERLLERAPNLHQPEHHGPGRGRGPSLRAGDVSRD